MESQEQTDPPEFIHLAVGVSVHRWGQALAGFQVLSSTNRIGQLRILAFRNLQIHPLLGSRARVRVPARARVLARARVPARARVRVLARAPAPALVLDSFLVPGLAHPLQ